MTTYAHIATDDTTEGLAEVRAMRLINLTRLGLA